MNSNIFQEDQNKYKSLAETHNSNLEIFKDILIGLYEIGTYNIRPDDDSSNDANQDTTNDTNVNDNSTIVYYIQNATEIESNANEFLLNNSSATLKRHMREVGTARLKGQAFNGYYDFVINEGSYKFWAAFQVP